MSENLPVALNCWEVARGTLPAAGVTVTERSVAVETVRGDDAEMPPETAVMVVLPEVREVTLPLLPAALLTVATEDADEPQITELERSCVVRSEKVPVAVNCSSVPWAIVALAGVMASDTSVAEVELEAAAPLLTPLPPHPEVAMRSSNNMMSLFNRICIHPRRNQGRHIGPSPQVPHVPPFLDNDVLRRKL